MKVTALYLIGLGLAAVLGTLPSWTARLSSPWSWLLTIPIVLFCYLLLEGIGSSLFGQRGEARSPFSFSARSALLALVLAIPFFAVAALARYLSQG